MYRTKNGFTLIELLVVIAIIAILAAILFPVFAKTKQKAQTTKCLSNLKQIGTAFQMYANDNGGKYPWGQNEDPGIDRAYKYLKNLNVYMCPEFLKQYYLGVYNTAVKVNYNYRNRFYTDPRGAYDPWQQDTYYDHGEIALVFDSISYYHKGANFLAVDLHSGFATNESLKIANEKNGWLQISPIIEKSQPWLKEFILPVDPPNLTYVKNRKPAGLPAKYEP